MLQAKLTIILSVRNAGILKLQAGRIKKTKDAVLKGTKEVKFEIKIEVFAKTYINLIKL